MEAVFLSLEIETSTILEKLVLAELFRAPAFGSDHLVEVFIRSTTITWQLSPKPS
jgi:hypothetical protein